MTAPTQHERRRTPRRAWRVTRLVLIILAALLVIVIVGFLIWANTGVMQAEKASLEKVRSNPAVSITERDNAVVLAPTGRSSGVGLVFIPGAKVAADAYLYKLSGAVAQDGLTVVITKPILNLAFFDQRPLSDFTSDARGISTWYVGGHSLGGVRACQYADQPKVTGLILFGSYCANDLSSTKLAVLSIGGSNDGLSTPSKIKDAAGLLPADATFVQIEGSNHARFGDYGVQAGDGVATISSAKARRVITEGVTRFLPQREE
ncbi:alpha/beta hydrolase [Parafrigoribacterium soli]|uniref:alpha/beta hydrolase n=1 Tax=Parafrigoribacterium soli TaxID=3144663 RepID=UPI0032F00543